MHIECYIYIHVLSVYCIIVKLAKAGVVKKAFLDSFLIFNSDIFICQKNVRFTKPVFKNVKKRVCD